MPQNFRKAGTAALLTVLFAIGVLHWVFFYNLAHLSFTAYDWPKEFSYYSIIRQALIQHFIPFHISRAFQETDRFLALPETLLSPQILLLPAMKIGQFAMFNTLFMYCGRAFYVERLFSYASGFISYFCLVFIFPGALWRLQQGTFKINFFNHCFQRRIVLFPFSPGGNDIL